MQDLVSVLRAAGARPSGQVLRLRGLSALRPQEVPTDAHTWLTSGARDLAKDQGKWYHEVMLRGPFNNPQVGWLSAHFQEGEYDGIGVGDDADGWAFDGQGRLQWHAGQFEAGPVVEECGSENLNRARRSSHKVKSFAPTVLYVEGPPQLPNTSSKSKSVCFES